MLVLQQVKHICFVLTLPAFFKTYVFILRLMVSIIFNKLQVLISTNDNDVIKNLKTGSMLEMM